MRHCLANGLVAAVLVAPQAHAGEAAGPTTSGPIVARSATCDQESRWSGWACALWFELLPAETNATEDYSVYWVQMGIDPVPGWCANYIGLDVDLPYTHRIVSVAPDRGAAFDASTAVTTDLLVDAEGNAPIPGRVYEDGRIGRGHTSVRWSPEELGYAWTGSSRGSVRVVLGLQIAGERIPPYLLSGWLDATEFGYGTCGPGRRSGR